MLAIVLPDQLAILVDAIGIVDVASDQEAQNVRLRGLEHSPELTIAEHAIADEADLADRRLLAFGDRVDEVDAVVAAVDDLGRHADVVAAVLTVGFEDAA